MPPVSSRATSANGTSTYKPNNTLTRGQVSAIVWRMKNSVQ
ncbi:MAG: hypothetical protein ACLSHO_05380 [Dysosmobacter sp.]